jgi:hypothetical protein
MKSPQEDEAVLDGGDTSRFDPEDACGYNPDVPTVDVATQAPKKCGLVRDARNTIAGS